jgi:uncharacterized protein (DUF1778 family)
MGPVDERTWHSARQARYVSTDWLVFPGTENSTRGGAVSDESQISATVSASTKEKFDRSMESHGLKKNFVIEPALLYFAEARRDLPDEAFIPGRIVLDDEAFDRVAQLLDDPRPAPDALRELMRSRRG